jgi:hypothetical protein
VRRGGVTGSLAAALRGARQRVTEAGWSVVLTPVAAGTVIGTAVKAVAGAALPPGPHTQLIARLAETCADDTLRLLARRVTLAS